MVKSKWRSREFQSLKTLYGQVKRTNHNFTLILTEGDSAKQWLWLVWLLRKRKFGVFPLKGKPINVKDHHGKKIADNEELNNIKKGMGLQSGKVYNSRRTRYGKIMIMADQDDDGTHIKGLIFNLFHSLWPSLYKIDGFLVY